MAPNRGHSLARPAANGRPKDLKRKRDIEDVEQLTQRVADLNAKPDVPLDDFSELPLSEPTQAGLKSSHFTKMTTIQSRAIPTLLKGNDVLGAAKTGSGKTLAFIVPVLESLYRKRWTEYDGLGALILSPTRELAIQIFEVLRKVGRNHSFSAGLVIGGKSLQEERARLGRMNILVATPGRILQHMDQTADLDLGNLSMFVLDEADRIMDMGFQSTVDAIVDHLPKQRQTIMFSATQTKKVSDLARLSLSEPEFVSVHEMAESATPTTLQQNYVITPIQEKLDTLWSFIRANVKKKILVFLSSGKQVRFVYEAFRHLQPGTTLLHLHGRQKQTARLDITAKFSNSKYACLFSTDVAARGLDFPAVDWVVQVDCPEDADTYIHRVGRTARYERNGHAVLFLDPSEEQGMLSTLQKHRVTGVEEIRVKQKKMQNTVRTQLQNMCFKDPELKYLGQKAFVSYVRSVYVQKDKSIFDVKKLDLEAYAASLGLPGTPKVKFVKGEDAKSRKNMPRALLAMENRDDSNSGGDEDEDGVKRPKQEKEKQVRTKYDRMFERRNQDVLAEHYARMIDDSDSDAGVGNGHNADTADADDDDEFMAVKRRFTAGDEALGANEDNDLSQSSEPEEDREQILKSSKPNTSSIDPTMKKKVTLSSAPDAEVLIIDSKRRAKLLQSKKALAKFKGHGSHVVFDDGDEDDNQGHEKVHYEREEEFKKKGDAKALRQQFLDKEKERAARADVEDREVAREKRREKKIKRKERAKAMEMDDGDSAGNDDGEVGVQLMPYNEDDDRNEYSQGGSEEEEQPKKKQKKWFQKDDSDDDDDEDDTGKKKRKKRGKKSRSEEEVVREPQTLEDLEAMASSLLAR